MGSKTKSAKKRMVDIDTLRLGFDLVGGKVMLGVPDAEGVLSEAQPITDISEDFFNLINELMLIRGAVDKQAPRIVVPTEAEKRNLKLV